jgi:hypothetical protein
MSVPPAHKSDNTIRLVVVTNSEQLLHAYAVRSICFMEETGLAARRAFDGNDFQATHIVAYADDEPVGATRIRWFNGFAKIERTAFRKAYRSVRTLKQTLTSYSDMSPRRAIPSSSHWQSPTTRSYGFGCLGFGESPTGPRICGRR